MDFVQSSASVQTYEDSLAELLTVARSILKDPEFGADVHALAKMTFIPGISGLLEDELLSIARTVARRRRRQSN